MGPSRRYCSVCSNWLRKCVPQYCRRPAIWWVICYSPYYELLLCSTWIHFWATVVCSLCLISSSYISELNLIGATPWCGATSFEPGNSRENVIYMDYCTVEIRYNPFVTKPFEFWILTNAVCKNDWVNNLLLLFNLMVLFVLFAHKVSDIYVMLSLLILDFFCGKLFFSVYLVRFLLI
jgi:hypothetical protein